MNLDLDINEFAPFPSRLLGIQKDDLEKEDNIKLEFNELEVDESYLTRDKDLDSDEEAYIPTPHIDDYISFSSFKSTLDSNFEEQEVNSNFVNSSFDANECIQLCSYRHIMLSKEDTQEELSMSMNIGDDHWDSDEEECCPKQAVDDINMDHSPIMEELCYNDLDFLGIEAFFTKTEVWIFKGQSFGPTETYKHVKELSFTLL